MASSGTEIHWAEPGLGKGPQRRRWAWAEDKRDVDRSGSQSWGEEGLFPNATSPELLEDFRLAQQHQPPLEWNPHPQPDGHQDSESGETSGAEAEAEDADSPAISHEPLAWLPPQGHQLEMTEEEPDGTLGSPEVEDAGESCPRLGYEAGLSLEGHGNTSPMALGQGQVRGWVASGEQAGGDKLSEHSEVNPSIELSPARSWSSGTVSLDHPSDSLDSTWEGEIDGSPPTALAETLPESPSYHLLNPDDRTGGSVAQATPIEFQDSSAPPAQSPQRATDRWRRETTRFACPQPKEHIWKPTKTSPKPLPSRFIGSISPLNPQPRPIRQGRLLPRQGATLAGRSSSNAPKYGRGQLNYPLPDFSKVGPRVRFPKDESYHPPKSRSHNRQPQAPARPLIFKSPAEIVQEVLLSSGEAAPGKDMPPAHPITRVPQEFQTPEQATELVHQLQEDYHRLLTKYAEAENTIDQLRLGAKVNLFSDPPQPSRSIHTGMVPQGTKVLSFTIPQPRSAEWWPSPAEDPQASVASGWPSAGGDLSPSLPTSKPTLGWLPENRGVSKDQSSADQTQALASQARQFLAKVESFERLIQAGRLMPQDQLKGFLRLKAAHAALEEEYLKACREQLADQPLAGSVGTPGRFDPGRELEAEIYRMGSCLEELKEHIDQNQQEPELPGSDSALDSSPALPCPHQPMHLPASSRQAPTLAIKTSHCEPATTTAAASTGPCPLHVNVEVSSGNSEVEDRPQDPLDPLRDKELQTEQVLHGLLERYLSVKSLPEAMRMEEEEEGEEEEEEEEEGGNSLEVDGVAAASGKAEATGILPRQCLVQAEKSHRAPLEEATEQMESVKPPGFQTSLARDGHMSGLGKAEAAPPGPSMPPHPPGTKSAASHQSSMTSLEGSGISERLAQKPLHQAGGSHLEEPWMASPETDSGFVGSETSRVSPLTQTPEHRLSHISTAGTLAQPFTTSAPRDGASYPKARGSLVPRRATEPGTPRSRAQRHLSCPSGPPRQRAPSCSLERVLATEMVVPGSESEGHKRISEQLLPSKTISPPPTPAPATSPLPRGPKETIPNFPLTRAERDQAIRELQEEVSRLRVRLEDSLHRPGFDRPARARGRPVDSPALWGPHYGSKSTERLSGEPRGGEQTVSAGRRRARSSSVPREVPRLSLSSDSELPPLPLFSEMSRTTEDSPQAARDRKRGSGSAGWSNRVTFRGQYTGHEYHVLSPKAVPKGNATVSCPHCRPIRTQNGGDAATGDPLGPPPADTLQCPMCGRVGYPREGNDPGSATSGAEATTRRKAPSTPSPKQRSKQAGSSPCLAPGLWYLAAAPSTPAPPAFAYISSVPVMPYPPAAVYYAPAGPTSAQPAAKWPPTASPPPARGHRHSIQLHLGDLEELNKALSRAVQAAESVRSTTRQMSRSLSADLRQAHSLRGSCLF
ncbi:microtubule organization protein AKNA isoform X2 [Callithrix jacchus]|uniref:AT-hook transcription factor n=1 Tax=Callithrix jacchus TaxID=9483 RepID=F7HK68_CALJA|nr:microtubule organization protein AKNA [Callithrix jacchus]XP_035111412.2 microtubule organization protein AKNA [Callithrix jacchus]XP_035111415.2 microtubule organization protein AKNA [Callithrix jacchus]XP_054092174.1 microtubule organization protein AKNA [Callithrix jacchus]